MLELRFLKNGQAPRSCQYLIHIHPYGYFVRVLCLRPSSKGSGGSTSLRIYHDSYWHVMNLSRVVEALKTTSTFDSYPNSEATLAVNYSKSCLRNCPPFLHGNVNYVQSQYYFHFLAIWVESRQIWLGSTEVRIVW